MASMAHRHIPRARDRFQCRFISVPPQLVLDLERPIAHFREQLSRREAGRPLADRRQSCIQRIVDSTTKQPASEPTSRTICAFNLPDLTRLSRTFQSKWHIFAPEMTISRVA